MKRIVLFIVVILMVKFTVAQTDTLFSGKKAIPCKIVEISESEFKYKKAELPDGPTYVIDRAKVTKYTLASGYSETVVLDELSLEHEHKEILGNREVIKIQPFSLALNYISIGYEKVIKVGTNLDIEAGYMNNAMTTNQGYYSYGMSSYGNVPFTYGLYFKPGVKFFLGQDFSVKGLKYAHPLKGRYIRLDLAVSYLNLQNVRGTYYTNPGGYPYNTSYQVVTTDINSIAYGGFISYGRQFILGNILTLDYYLGLGFTAQTNSYSNSAYNNVNPGTYNYYRDDARSLYRYGAFLRVPSMGISGTAGLRLGYIIPSKKAASLPKKATAVQK
jgi:hypothetical protein